MPQIAPIRHLTVAQKPWEGVCDKKPWEYPVAATIPVLDTPDILELAVELLRRQTVRPYIIVIDTGSTAENLGRIEAMRADDLEVHSVRANGYWHPSDPPAIACDLAFALCRSPYLFTTHADVFLRRRDFLESLVPLCEKYKAVGYEITPRHHKDWPGMISHTASMFDIETMDKIGAGWSLRRCCNLFGIKDPRPDPSRPGWPDTEVNLNYCLRQADITPYIIGKEKNYEPTKDENIFHFRTYTGSMLYSPGYHDGAREWAAEAIAEANANIKKWS